MLQAAVREDDIVAVSCAETVTKPAANTRDPDKPRLEFVSLTVISGPDQMMATIKLLVDDVQRVFSHEGGVGPVDAICGALRDLEPDIRNERCWTEEPHPGSDAVAVAKAEFEWSGVKFRGVGNDRNTLNASVLAFVDALNKITSFKKMLGGRSMVTVHGRWAGFLVEEAGGSRGLGERSFETFLVTYDPKLGLHDIALSVSPRGKHKRALAKGWHHEHRFDHIRSKTLTKSTCDLFLIAEGEDPCQLS